MAAYPKSPKWGSFKHNIDHHNWQTRGIPQLTYACIVHCTCIATCTCHYPCTTTYSRYACLCSPYELETARGQHRTKRTAPEAVQDSGVLEDKAWQTQCAVEWRTGLRQAATATPLLEDSVKRADNKSAPPLSYAADLDRLPKKYEVGDILRPPRKEGATEPLTLVTESPRSQGSGAHGSGAR